MWRRHARMHACLIAEDECTQAQLQGVYVCSGPQASPLHAPRPLLMRSLLTVTWLPCAVWCDLCDLCDLAQRRVPGAGAQRAKGHHGPHQLPPHSAPGAPPHRAQRRVSAAPPLRRIGPAIPIPTQPATTTSLPRQQLSTIRRACLPFVLELFGSSALGVWSSTVT